MIGIRYTVAIKPRGWKRNNWTMVLAIRLYQVAANGDVHDAFLFGFGHLDKELNLSGSQVVAGLSILGLACDLVRASQTKPTRRSEARIDSIGSRCESGNRDRRNVQLRGHSYQGRERVSLHLQHDFSAVSLDRDLADSELSANLFI